MLCEVTMRNCNERGVLIYVVDVKSDTPLCAFVRDMLGLDFELISVRSCENGTEYDLGL